LLGNLESLDLLVLVLVWFLTSMVANLLWTRFVLLRYVGRALMSWLDNLENDPEGQRSIEALLDRIMKYIASAHFEAAADKLIKYLFEREINTGRKIRVATDELDKDGKPVMTEIDEVLTPISIMGRQIGDWAVQKLKGQAGGVKAQIGRIIQDEAASDGGPGLSPAAMNDLAKGKFKRAASEVAVRWGLDKLKKGPGNISGGGGGDRY